MIDAGLAPAASGEFVRIEAHNSGSLDPHDEPLIRIRARNEAVLSHPVRDIKRSHLGRQQWQHRAERVEAEMAIWWNADAAAFGHFEIVADAEAAHGTSFDPIDGDTQIRKFEAVIGQCGASFRDRYHPAERNG